MEGGEERGEMKGKVILILLIAVSLLAAIALPQAEVAQASPDTATLYPNEDITTQWYVVPSDAPSHYSVIDEGVATPNDSDYIYERRAVDEFGLTTVSGIEECTAVTVKLRGRRESPPDFLHVKLFKDGTQIGGSWDALFPYRAWGNVENTWSGLNLSQSDIDGLRVRLESATHYSVYVSALEVEVTYSASAALSTAIDIRAQDYTSAVSSITFPEASPGSSVSQPYNNVDGSGSPQGFGDAGTAKPVVTLVNTAGGSYIIWYNIATFTNAVVSAEHYLVNTNGAACESATAINNAVTFDANTSTGVTIAPGVDKDLYLKVVLSSVGGKSGSSTLTILGETA